MYLSTTGLGRASESSQREQHAAVGIVALAVGCVAADLVDPGACECSYDKRCPHAPVEFSEPRLGADERAERAGRGRDHRAVAAYLGYGCLVAEAAERSADTFERGSQPLSRTKSRLAGEFLTEGGADLAQAHVASSFGQGIDNQADQLLVAALWKLERGELRRDSIRLGRPSGAGAGVSRPPLERANQQARVREPLESAAGDVAVNPLGGGDVICRHGQRLPARVEQRLAQPLIANRVEPMHHFLETW
jgi:hypothetical protein